MALRALTAPEETPGSRAAALADLLLERQPNEPLPEYLIAQLLQEAPPASWTLRVRAHVAGVQSRLQRPSPTSSGCVTRAQSWVERAPPESEERTERAVRVAEAAVIPTMHLQMDAQLQREVHDTERLTLESLADLDPEAELAARSPVLRRVLTSVVFGGRGVMSFADRCAATRSLITALCALEHARNHAWLSRFSFVLVLFLLHYMRSAAVMSIIAALGIGAPAASTVRALYSKCKLPTVAEERAMLHVFMLACLFFTVDNVGHYKLHKSYADALATLVRVYGSRTVLALAPELSRVQFLAHCAPMMWLIAVWACDPNAFVTAAEEARQNAHVLLELTASIKAVQSQSECVDGEWVDAVSEYASAAGDRRCPEGCGAFFGSRRTTACPHCHQTLVACDAVPAGAEEEAAGVTRHNARKSTRRIRTIVTPGGSVEAKRAKLADGPHARPYLNVTLGGRCSAATPRPSPSSRSPALTPTQAPMRLWTRSCAAPWTSPASRRASARASRCAWTWAAGGRRARSLRTKTTHTPPTSRAWCSTTACCMR
jgi:hypothetical protein